MGYTDNLKEPIEITNNLFNKQEAEIKRLEQKLHYISWICNQFKNGKISNVELVNRIERVL